MSRSGFYGKLAGRGDFVQRDLPPGFVEPWDAWLAAGIQASRSALGDGWLDAYLVSPLWRFALAPGLVGPEPMAGALMPSIDRVGRYFPLTIAQPLAADIDLASLVGGPEDWFEAVEALLLSTLEEGADFELFQVGVAALPELRGEPRRSVTPGFHQVHFGVTSAAERRAALAQLGCDGASLWWGRGSERVAPGLLCVSGMPAAQGFISLLLGADVCTLPADGFTPATEGRP